MWVENLKLRHAQAEVRLSRYLKTNQVVLLKNYKENIVVEKQGYYLTPYQRQLLLTSLQADLRPEYRRRIEIMLLADEGQSQTQICEALGCAPETARYWIAMARTGNIHIWNERPSGRPKAINQQYLDRLKELMSHSPRDYGYPFQRWTAQWLGKHLAKELGIEISNYHITRLLKSMGLSTRQTSKTIEKRTDNAEDSSITIGDLQLSFEPISCGN